MASRRSNVLSSSGQAGFPPTQGSIRTTSPPGARTGLRVYNAQGQLVKTLVNELMETGHYEMTWDGTNNSGQSVVSGVYFYRLRVEAPLEDRERGETKRMVLLD